MARKKGRIPPGGKAPFCADCGSLDCHVVVTDPEVGSLTWLCGSCEYLRANPKAKKAKVPPGLPSTWRKRKRNQDETLW